MHRRLSQGLLLTLLPNLDISAAQEKAGQEVRLYQPVQKILKENVHVYQPTGLAPGAQVEVTPAKATLVDIIT